MTFSADRTDDEQLDGGNIDVQNVSSVIVVVGAGTTEYVAWSGNLDSNTILVDGLPR